MDIEDIELHYKEKKDLTKRATYWARDLDYVTRVFDMYDDLMRRNEPIDDSDKEEYNKILTTVKGSAVASDQAYRDADLAIDYCEDITPLPKSAVDKIVNVFLKAGAVAKISSIHVNGWFGDYDKLKMTRILLGEYFQLDDAQFMGKIVFTGDSPNDEPMFNYFKNSVGVANIINYADQIKHFPAWVTTKNTAEGFSELADKLLSAKAGS